MESKHTPGPWGDAISDDGYSVDHDSGLRVDPGLCWKPVGPRDNHAVALVVVPSSFGMDDELDANARLIAAAPELLEALKRLLAFVEEHTEAGEVIPPHTMEHDRARAAIAKATGK